MSSHNVMIQNIRYWDSAQPRSPLNSVETTDFNKEEKPESVFNRIQQTFDSSLFDLLGQKNSRSNSFFGYDLNSSSQLREASNKAKSLGMEKVLAAQLASPLPFSNVSSKEKNSSYNGLNDIASLTIELQIAKARRRFSQSNQLQSMSLNEFIQFVEKDEKD